MKLIYALTLPIVLLSGVFGLIETKKITLTDGSKVDYNIDENKALNGAYTVSSPNDKVWLRGSYKDNARIGNWYCFNSDGSMVLRYSYDLKKIIAIDDKMLAKISFSIKDKDESIKEKATVPVPICSIDQYVSLFNEQIYSIITKEQKNLPKELPVDIIASINAKGAVTYKLGYTINGLNFTNKLVVIEKMYDLEWAPAMYEGKIVPSDVVISSKLVLDGNKLQRFIWNY